MAALVRGFPRTWRSIGAVASTVAAASVGCVDCGQPPEAEVPAVVPPIERTALPGDALRGLSGLARPPSGGDTYYAVAERLHHVVPLHVGTDGWVARRPIPMRGVDAELDVEGLAFIDDETLVLATEADHARDSEKVLFARWTPREVIVFRLVEFDYEAWGLVPARNRGLEGICAAGDQIVAASEMVGQLGAHRWSPVATYDLAEEAWTPYRVFATSDTGKLSGLTCERVDGGLEVTAIERHFDLLHVVRFRLDGRGGDVQAEIIGDLRPGFAQTPPNFEGIERAGPGVYFLITDNDWRGVRGPTEMIRWEEAAAPRLR